MDQRLHRREVERGAQPAEDRPEGDDRREALRKYHGERPNGVEHHADNERALAPEQITTGTMQLFQVVFSRGANNEIPWTRGSE